MGAWSEETFGNDTACDWIGEFLDSPSLAAVEEALDAALEEDDYLDSDIACEALAACEVIARLKANWGVQDAYSEALDQWIEANPLDVPEDLVNKAEAAIARITGENSELRELWDEGGYNDAWHDCIEDLAQRVAD